tara:strand:- start:960 stop:1178 length:219 start_codon:yes stop_codon:yes gene_type:complete
LCASEAKVAQAFSGTKLKHAVLAKVVIFVLIGIFAHDGGLFLGIAFAYMASIDASLSKKLPNILQLDFLKTH